MLLTIKHAYVYLILQLTNLFVMNKISNLLKKQPYLRILEAHSGLFARSIEQSKFDGIWVSSLTDSGSKGLPDIELVSIDSRLQTVQEICNVSTASYFGWRYWRVY